MKWAQWILVLALGAVASCSTKVGAFPVVEAPDPDPEPEPPAPDPGNSRVSGLAAVNGPDGIASVTLLVHDPESDPVTVLFEYSVAGVEWFACGLVDVAATTAATPAGSTLDVQWYLDDLGFRGVGGFLRATPTDLDGVGTSQMIPITNPDRRRARAADVEFYMIHYGGFSDEQIRVAETYDLVILHPFSGNLPAAIVHDIADGIDPSDPADDVLVLGYISIGEDLRTVGITDEEMLLDPRFVGDGTGPRIDPRGPGSDGQRLTGLDPLGLPTTGPTGYASWYLDDNDTHNSPTYTGDGKPDRNVIFGGCFVNAGDPKWFDALDGMEFDGVDGMPGIKELLTGFGRGYGCDGLFLDTIDTCAPNSFTDETSPNQSEYEWTAQGFTDFMELLDARYPQHIILQNRGLFFFDPRHPHYEVSPRASIHYLKFESFRLNSNQFEDFDPFFFPDNKFNVAPKLMAEANRDDGFTVLSLGYAEGPAIDLATLNGESTAGLDTLIEDILENQDRVGFRHYITDGGVAFSNTFVRDFADMDDREPPVWTSTYNANIQPFPTPPGAPASRIGVQQAVAGTDEVTVRWDVALDLNRVNYVLYMSDIPLDFADLSSADRIELEPEIGAGYAQGVGPTTYAHQATIGPLERGSTFYFCIRAVDRLGNEDQNEVVLTARLRGLETITIDGEFDDWDDIPLAMTDPDDADSSSGPNWREIQVANDLDNVYIRFTSENAFNLDGGPGFGFSRTLILIDTDDDAATGYSFGSVGSELMVSGDTLNRQEDGSFNAGQIQVLSVNPETNVAECELAIPISRIRAESPGTNRIRILFLNDETFDTAPDAGYLEFDIVGE